MHVKIFSLFLSFALLLPNFASAAPAFTCTDVQQMKNNHRDSRWKSGNIWQLHSRYAKIFSCIKGNKSLKPEHNFWESIVRYHMSKMETYFAQDAGEAEKFVNSVNAIAHSYGGQISTVCFDRRGRRVDCNKKRNNPDGERLTSALEQQRQEQQADTEEREAAYYLSLVENIPLGKSRDQEEKNALLKIYDAVKNRKDISKFIAKLAADHTDITPSFITSAFMLYAESLPGGGPEQGLNEIYKYTGSSYDEVIRFSAARAVALYSADRLNASTGEEIDNSPAGKFWLRNEHRAHIAKVLGKAVCGLDINKENEKLLYVAVVSDLARVYELGSGEDMFANAANFLRCSGGGNGASYLAGAMVLALPYAAEGGAAAGAAGFGVFIYALNDAYVYPTPMQNLMRNFDSYVSSLEETAPAVEEFPINNETAECTLNCASVAWERDFVKYGAREATAANTATCKQTPQPNDPCGDIRLNDLDGRVSMSRDFVKRFKEYLTHQGIPYSSNTIIRDILGYSFRGDYRKILELLNNKCVQKIVLAGKYVHDLVTRFEYSD
ncbi:hypothetical protein, partial [Candidatus Proelusimicrobium excrementi]|uniref:hypothetical protein n=1 Tax=Candidatus Proelusimicrobium excrementi TaxID=3416222 RepID=UPI003D0DAD2F